jgi:hypothetical protein
VNDVMEVRAVRVAHAINALVVLGTFAAAILGHRQQPDRVPVHFDLAGFPDRWDHKSWGNTLAVPLLSLATTAFIYGSAQVMGWARRHPGMLNLPDKGAFLALSPELQDPIWRQMKALIYWLAVPVTFVFLTMASLGPGEDGRLRVWPLFVSAGLVLILPTVLAVRLLRRVRKTIAAGARRIPA